MAENQKGSTGLGNQESKLNQQSGSRNTSEMNEGKAKGTPSNVQNREKDTDMSKKNKEGNPDESRIQGDRDIDKTRRTDSNTGGSRRDDSGGAI